MSGLVELARTAREFLMNLLKSGMAVFKQNRERRAKKMRTPVNTDDIQ